MTSAYQLLPLVLCNNAVLTDQIETFNSRDMLSLGQTHAFISYIRAGRMKQDIVEVGRN